MNKGVSSLKGGLANSCVQERIKWVRRDSVCVSVCERETRILYGLLLVWLGKASV